MTRRHDENSAHRTRQRLAVAHCMIVIGCLVWLSTYAQAQSGVIVTASFAADSVVTPDTAIELRLNRVLAEGEGRIAIVIGRTDVTSLFVSNQGRFTYVSSLVPLPLGKSDVVVYQIAVSGQWHELARLALNVSKELPTPTPTPAV